MDKKEKYELLTEYVNKTNNIKILKSMLLEYIDNTKGDYYEECYDDHQKNIRFKKG
jgi:F0F1-type ATP synthase delta subunit